MKVKSIWLRRIHKWVGLVIGVQFVLWTVSGAAMALLDMEEVAGGKAAETASRPLPSATAAWPRIQRALAGERVTGVALRPLPSGRALEVTTANDVRLFEIADGAPVVVDARLAAAVARAAHPGGAPIARVTPLRELTLAVREHALPIWRVDFGDARNSSYYVSGSTGAILERRNDTWRWWDFFWMLHNMDYAERTSFNHPLIVMVGFAMAWLACTGFWLLFRTMWRHDFRWARAIGRRAEVPLLQSSKP